MRLRVKCHGNIKDMFLEYVHPKLENFSSKMKFTECHMNERGANQSMMYFLEVKTIQTEHGLELDN